MISVESCHVMPASDAASGMMCRKTSPRITPAAKAPTRKLCLKSQAVPPASMKGMRMTAPMRDMAMPISAPAIE